MSSSSVFSLHCSVIRLQTFPWIINNIIVLSSNWLFITLFQLYLTEIWFVSSVCFNSLVVVHIFYFVPILLHLCPFNYILFRILEQFDFCIDDLEKCLLKAPLQTSIATGSLVVFLYLYGLPASGLYVFHANSFLSNRFLYDSVTFSCISARAYVRFSQYPSHYKYGYHFVMCLNILLLSEEVSQFGS